MLQQGLQETLLCLRDCLAEVVGHRGTHSRECGEADLERTDASCGDPTASMPPWCHWAISVRVFLIVAESMPFGFEMSTTFSGVPVPALGTLPLLPPGGATVSVPLMPEQSSS